MKEQKISWTDFTKVDMRIGTIISAKIFEAAKSPAYQLEIDFGTIGIRKSSAQITTHYKPAELIGKQIVAVVNFPPKQIATMMSECLVLGALNNDESVVLIEPERKIENGLKIG